MIHCLLLCMSPFTVNDLSIIDPNSPFTIWGIDDLSRGSMTVIKVLRSHIQLLKLIEADPVFKVHSYCYSNSTVQYERLTTILTSHVASTSIEGQLPIPTVTLIGGIGHCRSDLLDNGWCAFLPKNFGNECLKTFW